MVGCFLITNDEEIGSESAGGSFVNRPATAINSAILGQTDHSLQSWSSCSCSSTTVPHMMIMMLIISIFIAATLIVLLGYWNHFLVALRLNKLLLLLCLPAASLQFPCHQQQSLMIPHNKQASKLPRSIRLNFFLGSS